MLKRRRDQWKFFKVAKICNLQISEVANFRNLQNFATLLPLSVDCFLTRLLVVLYKLALDVILVHLHSFIISLY